MLAESELVETKAWFSLLKEMVGGVMLMYTEDRREGKGMWGNAL